jgi:hypothetical protein
MAFTFGYRSFASFASYILITSSIPAADSGSIPNYAIGGNESGTLAGNSAAVAWKSFSPSTVR